MDPYTVYYDAANRFKSGDVSGALALFKKEEGIWRALASSSSGFEAEQCLRGLVANLNNQALAYQQLGDLDKSLEYAKKKAIVLKDDLHDDAVLALCLSNQAKLLYEMGDLTSSTSTLQEESAILRQLGDNRELCRSLHDQAAVLILQSDLEGALKLLDEEEQICRDIDDKYTLATCLAQKSQIKAQQCKQTF